MGSISTGKPHAVCVPFPAQGHMIPMMQLAQLLHSRGFYITFVNTEFNHKRLVRSKGPDWVNGFTDFQFETIPDGLPPSDRDATQDPEALCDSLRKNCLAPFRDLLTKLNSSIMEVPQVTCIISDAIMSFAVNAAEEIGIPGVRLWTSAACTFMGCFQYPELIRRGIVPFKDESFMSDGSLDTPIDWIPGMKNIRLKDIPTFIRTTDPNDIMLNYLSEEIQNCLKASAMIFNTFDALEHEVLREIESLVPRIYTIGPLSLLSRSIPKSQSSSFRPSLWKEDTTCLQWLDKQQPSSVIYVNYGSVALITDHHLKELAWGLANSKHPFLWIVRPDVVMGDSAMMPKEFLEETKDRGLVVTWCPQEQVLSHPSVGAFLTHCGWNSTLETICEGVPILCWPWFADQQTNCRYSCTEWGIGVEVNDEVKRDEVEALVKEMMGGEKGKQLRKNALEWKTKAQEACNVGGSSSINFDRFITEALQ